MPRWVAALRLLGIGFFIGACILLGVLTGLWVDNKMNAAPAFTIIGLMLGIITAGYGVYQMLQPLLRNKQSKEND
jgi:F0F1-type ATP synthase assembly protein I